MTTRRNKTLLGAEDQWQRSIEYLYFLHRNRWCTWEQYVRIHELRIRWRQAEPVPEAELRQSWLQARADGPLIHTGNCLWMMRGAHRAFVAGDVLPVTARNGMIQRYCMSGVTSKGVRLNHYYLPLNSRDRMDFRAAEFPDDFIGKRWDDPAIGRFVADLRASSRSRVGACNPAPSPVLKSVETPQGLRFDGFYYSARGLSASGFHRSYRTSVKLKRHQRAYPVRSYLHFFPDGTAISQVTRTPLEKIDAETLARGRPQHGEVVLVNNTFSFSSTNVVGIPIEYAGVIAGDRLIVTLKTPKCQGRYVYKFRPFPCLTA